MESNGSSSGPILADRGEPSSDSERAVLTCTGLLRTDGGSTSAVVLIFRWTGSDDIYSSVVANVLGLAACVKRTGWKVF
jgi:hypothetical protein